MNARQISIRPRGLSPQCFQRARTAVDWAVPSAGASAPLRVRQ